MPRLGNIGSPKPNERSVGRELQKDFCRITWLCQHKITPNYLEFVRGPLMYIKCYCLLVMSD
jgi:hypothetical protein